MGYEFLTWYSQVFPVEARRKGYINGKTIEPIETTFEILQKCCESLGNKDMVNDIPGVSSIQDYLLSDGVLVTAIIGRGYATGIQIASKTIEGLRRTVKELNLPVFGIEELLAK